MVTNKCTSSKAIAHEKQCKYNYSKSKIGHIRNLYKNAKRRVKGKGTSRPHLYLGLPICTIEEFINFSINDANYNKLYELWKLNNYNIKFTPSLNRKDTTKGYTLDNIEIITFSNNCKLSKGNNNRDMKGRYAQAQTSNS